MSEWREMPLGELYDFASGLSKPRSAFGSGYPFLSFKDVFYRYFVPRELGELVNSTEKERTRCSIRSGDVFLTRTSETMEELGMSCVALHDIPSGTFNGFTKRLRPKVHGNVIPEYAGYFFRSPAFRQSVTAMSSMSTRASLNNEMLARLSITLPPLDEQRAIGEVLHTLDKKIDLNRRVNETLEAMARAIFKDWFVDFGPVRAKAEDRQPLGLAPEIAALFPDALDDEDKPAGWESVAIGDLCNIKSGKRPPEKANEPGPVYKFPVYGGNGIAWYTTETLYAPPFLITGRVGTLGTVFRVYEKSWVSDNALCCFPRSPDFLGLVYFFLQQLDFESLNSGSTQPLLTQTTLKAQTAVLGGAEVIRVFADVTNDLFSRIEHNTSENLALSELRDLLLPKLMSGEIRLKDAEKAVEEVA